MSDRTPSPGVPHPAVRPLVLPREGAFVVQTALGAQASAGRLRGRVEHLASGAASTFDTADQLLGFIDRILATQSPPNHPPASPGDRPRRER